MCEGIDHLNAVIVFINRSSSIPFQGLRSCLLVSLDHVWNVRCSLEAREAGTDIPSARTLPLKALPYLHMEIIGRWSDTQCGVAS